MNELRAANRAKIAMCRALIRAWRMNGNILDVLRGTYADLNGEPLPEGYIENGFINILFGSQFVGISWHVRTFVAAQNKPLSDALFDGKQDDYCEKLAMSFNWRKKKSISWSTKGGPRPTHTNYRISARAMDKRHDWNTCK